MRADMEGLILNRLLDKYERSSFYREGRRPARRILLNLYGRGKSDLPEYDIENSEKRIETNRAVKRLEKDGLIGFEWMKGDADHILERLWLRPEALEEAYAMAGRRPKLEKVEEIRLELLAFIQKTKLSWVRAYLGAMLERITETKKIPALLPKDPGERKRLLAALWGLEKEEGRAITARLFSIKYLGDSKTFETKVRPHLLMILRRYLDLDDDTRDDELLQQVGIVRYPEQFEFRGRLALVTAGGESDFSALKHGSSFSAKELAGGNLRIDRSVMRILSIENRANYFAALETRQDPTEIILYHGGQYSPSRKAFFLSVRVAMPENCQWMHWGDLDFGGFSMLGRLRREIDARILSYRMNIQEIVTYRKHCADTSAEYARRLLFLADQPELESEKEILEYLAQHRIRLEQEALLLE